MSVATRTERLSSRHLVIDRQRHSRPQTVKTSTPTTTPLGRSRRKKRSRTGLSNEAGDERGNRMWRRVRLFVVVPEDVQRRPLFEKGYTRIQVTNPETSNLTVFYPIVLFSVCLIYTTIIKLKMYTCPSRVCFPSLLGFFTNPDSRIYGTIVSCHLNTSSLIYFHEREDPRHLAPFHLYTPFNTLHSQ